MGLQKKYDVFISSKSEDYPVAEKVYDFLVDNGLSVFLASRELQIIGEAEYSEAVDDAIDATHHMIVVTTSIEHLTSKWVKHEWTTFANDLRSNYKEGNLLTILGPNVQLKDLPTALRHKQSFGIESYKGTILNYLCKNQKTVSLQSSSDYVLKAEKKCYKFKKEMQSKIAQVEADKNVLEEKASVKSGRVSNHSFINIWQNIWHKIETSDFFFTLIVLFCMGLVIGLPILLVPTPKESYEDAVYYESKIGIVDNAAEKAFKKYRRAARNGNTDAMIKVASWYLKGIGTSADEWKSIKWYRKASYSLLWFEKIDNNVAVVGQKCRNMEVIIIPKIDSNKDSVTIIRNSSFLNCSTAISIAIPNTIEKIDNFAFSECLSLEEIILPNSVKSVGKYVFNGCEKLTKIIIPESVENIGESCFEGCTSLKEIWIPKGTREKFEAMIGFQGLNVEFIEWTGDYNSSVVVLPSGKRLVLN